MRCAKSGEKRAPDLCGSESISLASTTDYVASPGDRGDDADGIAILGRSVLFGQIANIFVVHIYVHEAAQLPIVRKEVLAQIAEFRGQTPQRLAHCCRPDLRGIALPRVNPQRRWNNYLYPHRVSPG